MTTIGGFGHAPTLMGASKQSVAGEPLPAPQAPGGCPFPITTVEDLKLLIPAVSLLPRHLAQTVLDMAEVFRIDPADDRALVALFERYWRSVVNPVEFQNELNSRDKNGFTPLHNAVMQNKADLVDHFLTYCSADPSEQVSPVAYHAVAAPSIGARNEQQILDNSPYAGCNALTLAIRCKRHPDMIGDLAKLPIDGRKLVELTDGQGDTAVCLAVEHFEVGLGLLMHYPEAARLANGRGEKPLELAIKKGQSDILNIIVVVSYVNVLHDFAPEAVKVAALEDLTKAARLLAAHWTDLPNREGVLACLLEERKSFRAEDDQWIEVSVFPLQHCVDVLFEEALKRVDPEPDSYDLLEYCTAEDLGKRDYSLIQALLKHQADLLLDDDGESLLRWALDHENDILVDLCKKAGIAFVDASDSGSDSDA